MRHRLWVPLLVASFTAAARAGHAQACAVTTAALEAIGASAATTIIVDQTAMGIPRFAFNGYVTARRGDTALLRVADPPLRAVNTSRAPIPACLVDSLHWRSTPDSALFAVFGQGGRRWEGFRERFAPMTQFALVSQPVISGDTATIYVALASGPLAGHGVIMLLTRDADGRWAKRSEVQLWVS